MCEPVQSELCKAAAGVKRLIFNSPELSRICVSQEPSFWAKDEEALLLAYADLVDKYHGECDETRYLRLVIKHQHLDRRQKKDLSYTSVV